MASNGGKSTIVLESPSGEKTSQIHTNGGSTATVMTFYAAEDGFYKIYSVDEKLVVARVYREHTNSVEVSGTVTAPTELSDFAISFTNTKTGEVISANVIDGSYSVTLNEKYDYEVALLNASDYIVTSDNLISINEGDENPIFDITVGKVSFATLTGKIEGLSAEALKKLDLTFTSDDIYVPEIVVYEDGAYTLKLAKDIEYSIEVNGVNDYQLVSETKISASKDANYNFIFEEKTKYAITVSLNGIDATAKDSGVITFTNINEEGYSYTYSLTDESIALRDGQYSVKVKGTGNHKVAQYLTPDVKVNGGEAVANVKFTTINNWNFAKYNAEFGGSGIEVIEGAKYYLGLELSDVGVLENKTYLLLNNGGSIKIPVVKDDIVTVNYCYVAAFQFDDDATTIIDISSGSTSQIDTVTYTAKEDGYVTLKGIKGTNAQTYLTGIRVSTPVEYKATVTVGKTGCDYTTLNDALEAVRRMSRPNKERVTIEIQPGNYEEMLVIDIPNVTLKNASTNPSIALTDKGVGIADEAVRITSYYGHGYSYYSMGTDNKYNEDVLEVNKSNGYQSFTNPGTGTTNGSYWNATVVVMADGFNAEGIIFENSFNQYISEKEANDVVVLETGNKGLRSKVAGDTSVQDKSFVERAAALAIANNVKKHLLMNVDLLEDKIRYMVVKT